MANNIQILDEKTSNQIAAGEVIERPSAAVKELVENALDAGARHIVVELEDGGRSLIRVTDDGSGMGQEDAILALQRHATSKLRNADDLFQITTMGFRGEALPSIASVSQVTITTKEAAEIEGVGVKLQCVGGVLEDVQQVGGPSGTAITVENLFYNVPARLKFLKSSQTELGHIIEWVQRIALARPDVAFRIVHQGQENWASPGNGSLLDACVHVFGRDTARHLVPISYSSAGITVAGFIGTPAALKSSRSAQHIFVNQRFIRSKAVTRAVDDAYKSVQTLHGSRYPAAVLLIGISPAQVDVNVSPTKTEVRFTRESDIYMAVKHAVQEALLGGGLVPKIEHARDAEGAALPETFAAASSSTDLPERPLMDFPSRPGASRHSDAAAFREALMERAGSSFPTEDPFNNSRADLRAASSSALPSESEMNGSRPSSGTDYRSRPSDSVQVLAQTRNRYILAQTEQALLLIDQHIAHERVLYEQFKSAAPNTESGIPTQRLMLPLTLELDKRAALLVQQRLPELLRAGFELEPFGGSAFVVRAVPAVLAQNTIKAQGGPEATLREIIEEMVEKTISQRLLLPEDEILISASCKMAVKAGDPLTFEEMSSLVDQLLQCENPYTCPHGRPIIIELLHKDLDRKFGR